MLLERGLIPIGQQSCLVDGDVAKIESVFVPHKKRGGRGVWSGSRDGDDQIGTRIDFLSPQMEVSYVDRDRAAAVVIGNKDIKKDLKVRKVRLHSRPQFTV